MSENVELPKELRPILEVVNDGIAAHIRCRECGALFFSLKDAIRHIVTHDSRYRKFLSLIGEKG